MAVVFFAGGDFRGVIFAVCFSRLWWGKKCILEKGGLTDWTFCVIMDSNVENCFFEFEGR